MCQLCRHNDIIFKMRLPIGQFLDFFYFSKLILTIGNSLFLVDLFIRIAFTVKRGYIISKRASSKNRYRYALPIEWTQGWTPSKVLSDSTKVVLLLFAITRCTCCSLNSFIVTRYEICNYLIQIFIDSFLVTNHVYKII